MSDQGHLHKAAVNQNSSLGVRHPFPTTHWSVVIRASEATHDHAGAALAQLCETYWYPIYAFIRRRGNDHHDAVDLTQGFFAHLLEKNSLATVDSASGRFRAFLLASVKNYMTGQWRARTAACRGGKVRILSVDAEAFGRQYGAQLADNCSPEIVFERGWVESMLKNALGRLAQEYALAGKSDLYVAISTHLVATSDRIPQSEIASQLGISPAAVAMSVHRARKRYARLVREEVANTLADPSDVDDELARLMEVAAMT